MEKIEGLLVPTPVVLSDEILSILEKNKTDQVCPVAAFDVCRNNSEIHCSNCIYKKGHEGSLTRALYAATMKEIRHEGIKIPLYRTNEKEFNICDMPSLCRNCDDIIGFIGKRTMRCPGSTCAACLFGSSGVDLRDRIVRLNKIVKKGAAEQKTEEAKDDEKTKAVLKEAAEAYMTLENNVLKFPKGARVDNIPIHELSILTPTRLCSKIFANGEMDKCTETDCSKCLLSVENRKELVKRVYRYTNRTYGDLNTKEAECNIIKIGMVIDELGYKDIKDIKTIHYNNPSAGKLLNPNTNEEVIADSDIKLQCPNVTDCEIVKKEDFNMPKRLTINDLNKIRWKK